MVRKWGVLMLLTGFIAQTHATEPGGAKPSTDGEMTAEVKGIMRSVDAVKRLPVTGLSMIDAGNKTFLITDNGHFAVAGNFKLVDMWQGKIIGSVEDTKGIDKVDLRKIGLSPDELSTFTIGTGKKEVVIFVDPQCNYCHWTEQRLEPLAVFWLERQAKASDCAAVECIHGGDKAFSAGLCAG